MRRATAVFLLYLAGLFALSVYFYLDQSQSVRWVVKATERRPNDQFGIVALVGLCKIVSFTAGIAIPTIVTVTLIRGRREKRN